MESRRLPGKPLRLIGGKPMIAWVYHGARTSPLLDRLTVATDSSAIQTYCTRHGIPVVQTSAEHTSGTYRLIEVMDQEILRGESADIYVNIQGDEPMVTAGHLELLLGPFLKGGYPLSALPRPIGDRKYPARYALNRVEVSTLKVAISAEAAADPNAVKVVTDSEERALYFSRALIPYDRDATGRARCYKHLGFYAFSIQALQWFQSFPESDLERTEQLEQLRFLANGIPITVIETSDDTIGVDTEEDLKRVEEHFGHSGIGGPEDCFSKPVKL
jgi:3-deoxy-manno-octulosonate cytidylyltransferase (CMP-KDO synthetase)